VAASAEPIEVHRAYEAKLDGLQELWSDARERLVKMVVENHGYNPRECVPGFGALSVDIDGLTLVAAGDPDDEGESTSRHQLVLVPRSREMFKLLNRATLLNISVPFPGSTISGPYWVDLIVLTRKA
jgi:hypothetical protein